MSLEYGVAEKTLQRNYKEIPVLRPFYIRRSYCRWTNPTLSIPRSYGTEGNAGFCPSAATFRFVVLHLGLVLFKMYRGLTSPVGYCKTDWQRKAQLELQKHSSLTTYEGLNQVGNALDATKTSSKQ